MRAYGEADAPGTIDNWSTCCATNSNGRYPAADLLLSNVYDVLMRDVTDVKDLGSGVIAGVECDHLAFRSNEVDWQIWIAQGGHPYPCRYVITSKLVPGFAEYTLDVRDWKAGDQVAPDDFSFEAPADAKKSSWDIADIDELPNLFTPEGAK